MLKFLHGIIDANKEPLRVNKLRTFIFLLFLPSLIYLLIGILNYRIVFNLHKRSVWIKKLNNSTIFNQLSVLNELGTLNVQYN